MPQSQSNLDSCISDPTIGEVHKLVTYCVTTSRQGSLLRFLRWPPFPRPSFIPVRPISLFSKSSSSSCVFSIHTRGTGLVSYSYKAAPKSFRVNGATVKNIQNQLLSLTDSFNVPAKGGGGKQHLSTSTRYQAAGAAFEIYLSRGSDPCPLPLFLMDPGTAPFYGFTLEPCDSSDKLVNQPHSIPIIVGGNEGNFERTEISRSLFFFPTFFFSKTFHPSKLFSYDVQRL